jgi:hypothetical protein
MSASGRLGDGVWAANQPGSARGRGRGWNDRLPSARAPLSKIGRRDPSSDHPLGTRDPGPSRSFAIKSKRRTTTAIAWYDLDIETVLVCLSRYDVSVHALNVGRQGVRYIGRMHPTWKSIAHRRDAPLELGSICASRLSDRSLRILDQRGGRQTRHLPSRRVGMKIRIGCHTFQAKGSSAYLKAGARSKTLRPRPHTTQRCVTPCQPTGERWTDCQVPGVGC